MIQVSLMTPKIYISGTVDTTLYITELRPSSVSSSVKNIAELIEAVDGSVNYLHRNFKNSWNLSWQLIPKSTTSPIAINTVEQLKTFYYAFSMNTGILAGMFFYFVIYCLYKKNKPDVYPRVSDDLG